MKVLKSIVVLASLLACFNVMASDPCQNFKGIWRNSTAADAIILDIRSCEKFDIAGSGFPSTVIITDGVRRLTHEYDYREQKGYTTAYYRDGNLFVVYDWYENSKFIYNSVVKYSAYDGGYGHRFITRFATTTFADGTQSTTSVETFKP